MLHVVPDPPDVRAEQIFQAAAAQERAEAALTKVVGMWNQERVWETTKTRSPVTWLAFNLRISKARARVLLDRAHALRKMPLVAAAYFEGTVLAGHVDKLREFYDPEIAEIFTRDEEMLIGFAKTINRFEQFTDALREWQIQAFVTLGKTKTERQQKQRKLHMSQTFEGMWRFDGWIDPITGEIVNNELRRLADKLFEEDWAEAKAIWGDDTITAHLKRDDAQRLNDALGQMAMRSAVSDGQGRIVANIVMGNEAFASACRSAQGVSLSPDVIVPFLANIDVERMIVDSSSKLVDLGRRRAFTDALNRFIRFRDRYCQDESGCDVPAHLCETDHDVAWSKGGETNDSNGRSMCACHNRKKGAGPPQQRNFFGNDPPPAA